MEMQWLTFQVEKAISEQIENIKFTHREFKGNRSLVLRMLVEKGLDAFNKECTENAHQSEYDEAVMKYTKLVARREGAPQGLDAIRALAAQTKPYPRAAIKKEHGDE